MKSRVVQLAAGLGFAACRIARARAAPHAREFFRWLEQGRAGGMEWLARGAERRTDPRTVLPGARSVVVLAVNYWQGGAGAGAAGRVARYAWGEDYHEWMIKRMRPLAGFLESAGGKQKCLVDSGPLLERDFAAAAGIGWHGKSTMLIHRRMGAWFLLGEILTTIEMEPDPPETDHCGRCSRCMDACPTSAIVAPYQLDARRCLSYLTIENKGEIPEEFREALGGRIFGCDDCLDACPWNRFARESREAVFHARAAVFGRPLREFLELDEEGFRSLFRGSPVFRIHRGRFLRNVCVALGNTGAEEDLPALERAASDPEPLISRHAAWAVRRIRGRPAAGAPAGCPRILA